MKWVKRLLAAIIVLLIVLVVVLAIGYIASPAATELPALLKWASLGCSAFSTWGSALALWSIITVGTIVLGFVIDPAGMAEVIRLASDAVSSTFKSVGKLISSATSALASTIPTWVWLAGAAVLLWWVAGRNSSDQTVVQIKSNEEPSSERQT